MVILIWIVLGLVAGIVAELPSLRSGSRDGNRVILGITLGVVGALLGGWLGLVMDLFEKGETAGFILAIAGAIIMLCLYRLVLPPFPRDTPPNRVPPRRR